MAWNNRNGKGKIASSVLAGTAVSILLALLAAAITACLISGQKAAESSVGYAAGAITLVSAFAGSVTASARAGERRMAVSLVTAAVFFLSLLLLAPVLFGGGLHGVDVTALLIGAAGVASGLLGSGKAGKGKRKFRKKRF